MDKYICIHKELGIVIENWDFPKPEAVLGVSFSFDNFY